MSCPGSPGPKAQVRALPREPSCPGRLLYTFCQDMALQVCWVFWYESLCFFLAELSELGMMFLLGDWGSLRAGLCPLRLGLPEGRAVSPLRLGLPEGGALPLPLD